MSKKTFVLSDESVNSYGFSIDTSKLKLERFKANPVMLYNHGQLVGRWENLTVKDGKLIGDPVFMEDETELEALKVKKRVDQNFVKGASIGVSILAVTERKGEAPVVEAEVFECSVCDIPSNANAVVLYDRDGMKLEGEHFKLTLDKFKYKPKKEEDSMKLNAESLKTLGLTGTPEESAIDAAIKEMSDKNVLLSDKLKASESAKAKALVDTALSEGRIKATQKESFEKLAAQDFDLAKTTLESLPKGKRLAGKEESERTDLDGDRDKWTFKDWREKDTAGLLAMKTENPDGYAAILKK